MFCRQKKKKKASFICWILLLPIKEVSKWAGCVCWHVSDSEVAVQTLAASLHE